MPLIDPTDYSTSAPPPKPYWYIIFTIAVFLLITLMAVLA